MEFKDSYKIKLFNKIEEQYFRKNFGSMSKADLETLLFSEYIDYCLDHGFSIDDYTLSKELGITQSRIRSLKEKKELKYPRNPDDPNWWMEPFSEAVRSAKYDSDDHLVKFIVQDVNVLNEVRHFIEEKGWYDECSLNKKLLRIPMDCFMELCISDGNSPDLFSEETKQRLISICGNIKDIGDEELAKQLIKKYDKETLKNFLMKASKETVSLIIQGLPFRGIAQTAFGFLLNVINNS